MRDWPVGTNVSQENLKKFCGFIFDVFKVFYLCTLSVLSKFIVNFFETLFRGFQITVVLALELALIFLNLTLA